MISHSILSREFKLKFFAPPRLPQRPRRPHQAAGSTGSQERNARKTVRDTQALSLREVEDRVNCGRIGQNRIAGFVFVRAIDATQARKLLLNFRLTFRRDGANLCPSAHSKQVADSVKRKFWPRYPRLCRFPAKPPINLPRQSNGQNYPQTAQAACRTGAFSPYGGKRFIDEESNRDHAQHRANLRHAR